MHREKSIDDLRHQHLRPHPTGRDRVATGTVSSVGRMRAVRTTSDPLDCAAFAAGCSFFAEFVVDLATSPTPAVYRLEARV
jgi:hypothetical protein